MPTKLSENKLIVAISKGAEAVFVPGDWERLALMTDLEEYLGSTRLLRSLSFGDMDYGGHVVDFVRKVVRSNKTAEFCEFPQLMAWLEDNSPDAHHTIMQEDGNAEDDASVNPPPVTTKPLVARQAPLPPRPTQVATAPDEPSLTPPPATHSSVPIAPSGANAQTERYDVVVICALRDPELKHLERAGGVQWQTIPSRPDDTSVYQSTLFKTVSGKEIRVVAGAPIQMGMVASAVLTTKMILRFRPKLVAMVGIAAGIKEDKQGFGDILAANLTFDYGSGKISIQDGKTVFKPDPCPLPLLPRLQELLQRWKTSRKDLDTIYNRWVAKKPETALQLHIGPLGSGAAVVDSEHVGKEILEHWRKATGLEMEAYGAHVACRDATNPSPAFLCLKSICDFATKKDDAWQDYAAFTAAEFFYTFLVNEWDGLHL